MSVPRTDAAEGQQRDGAATLHKIAHNSATDSENKIHDDAEAQRLGLRGGLVPGVTLYAYLTELLLPLLGVDWLRRGTCSVRFVRPVYESDEVVCSATLTSGSGDPIAEPVTYDIAVLGPDGSRCAIGSAGLDLTGPPPEANAEARVDDRPMVTPSDRPPLTRETAPIGQPLAPRLLTIDDSVVESYADEASDPNPWYRGASPFGAAVVPPGLLVAQPARLLRQNFSYGPSVHTASEIQHLALPLAQGEYRIDGTITETFAKRGNDYLVANVQITNGDGEPVMRIRHSSIFNFAPRTSDQGG